MFLVTISDSTITFFSLVLVKCDFFDGFLTSFDEDHSHLALAFGCSMEFTDEVLVILILIAEFENPVGFPKVNFCKTKTCIFCNSSYGDNYLPLSGRFIQ